MMYDVRLAKIQCFLLFDPPGGRKTACPESSQKCESPSGESGEEAPGKSDKPLQDAIRK